MAALTILFDCVHVPPDESVIDWMVTLVGRFWRSIRPLAVIEPRFFTCHVIVPFVAPST
jgi:hypothetical protein